MKAESLDHACKCLVKKYGRYINSILSDSGSLILVVSGRKSEIRKYSRKLGFPADVKLTKSYLKDILKGDRETYSRISSSEILYDPRRLIDPVQEMVRSGEIVGTKESLFRKFIAIGEHFRRIDLVKYKVLDNICRSTVDISQALLMEKHNIFSTQKDTLKYLEKYLVGKGKLERRYLVIAAEIISTFKDMEHKKRESISGKEIDRLQKNAELFRNRLLELLEER